MNKKHIIKFLICLAVALVLMALGSVMVSVGYSLIGAFGILPALILWFELEERVVKWLKNSLQEKKE